MRTSEEPPKGLGRAATAGVFVAEVIAELAVRAVAALVACLLQGL